MACERHYTAATVAELQRIALLVELRKRISVVRQNRQRLYATDIRFDVGFMTALTLVVQWLDELSPVCDNPPEGEAVGLADYAEGMRP